MHSGVAGKTTVPIRTFELPTETLGALKEKIELQKQAVRELSARAGSLGARHPTTSTSTGFYPLPDGMSVLTMYIHVHSSLKT